MSKIRVLIVDDSSFMRRMIRDLIVEDDQCEVVATASNGEEAIRLNQQLKPDCITMDVEMPIMNGLDALKVIMKEQPVPVIMLSNLTLTGRVTTIEAMMNGAVDYLPKPSGPLALDLNLVKDDLLTKIKSAVKAKLYPFQATATKVDAYSTQKKRGGIGAHPSVSQLVCIGSSTGGPKALHTVVSQLTDDLPAPVLIVQHMPAHFTTTLAARLNQLSKAAVKEAEQGEKLVNGTVYIAPGGSHMKVKNQGVDFFIELTDEPPIKGLKPCFDVLLDSLTDSRIPIVYAILTGMGTDGTKGLRQIKASQKVYAIAESEETAVIYGMPKSAVQSGLVDRSVPLNEIAPTIINQLYNLRG